MYTMNVIGRIEVKNLDPEGQALLLCESFLRHEKGSKG